MKGLCVLLLVSVTMFPARNAPTPKESDEIPATRLHRVFPHDKLPDGQEAHGVNVQPRDLIQISIPCEGKQGNERLTSLKISIEGEAVETAAVAYLPVEKTADPKANPPSHDSVRNHRDLSCLVKAVKKGKATVKITPIDREGKERPVLTVIINVAD